MKRILILAAAALLLAGCGQTSLPGLGAAEPTEPAPVVVAAEPAQPETVVCEIHQDAPPAVVNNNTYTTIEAAEPAVEQVVYVREESGYRGSRRSGPRSVVVPRPVVRVPLAGPRNRSGSEPPRVPDKPNPPPGQRARPLPGGQGGTPTAKRIGPLPGGQKGGAPSDVAPQPSDTPDSDSPLSPNSSGLSQKGRG